ncbi:MAG TPA: branched-chain amino acid ABC transporter permease [Bacillota bacterium]|nr:branched-chain amino acid ABC transporter permease [Bacillota bacterium]HRS20599.1 branched-chain amino acid ABC transporter permease [Clostridia bacterium]HQE66473.1 branched-chain amino acid ABC transporter permease [Bacillota bacterium]HQI16431.1 branched-chain amino acid ABC transporter permease [Bacillota bacterium]HQJ38120.1 branched-chain amino acid ABC transporter permease [Bacillota bacterium]
MNFLKDKKVYLIIVLLYVVISALNKFGLVNSYLLQIIMLAGINIIMTVSLNIVNGFTGQFSIGQAGFMAIGGYASALFTTILFNTASWPAYTQIPMFIFSLFMGGVAASFIGFLIGLPTLRLKGDYLAIVTLAFGEVVRASIRLIDFVGGPRGLAGIPRYTNLFWVFLFTFLAIYGARNFVNSSFGRACISIRENEVASETMGINTTKYKVLSFTFAAFMAGVAGGLFGHLLMFLQPDTFSFLKSNDYLVFLYAGGAGSISGSIVSGLVLTIVPEMLRFMSNWRIVIYALVLVMLMLKRPEGLYGGKEFKWLKPKKRTVIADSQSAGITN